MVRSHHTAPVAGWLFPAMRRDPPRPYRPRVRRERRGTMGIEGTERVDTVIVGGGQAGLATGYHLKRLGHDPLILDAHGRVGDAWRTRWDSLRLFTYARYSGLPGMRFPAPGWSFPTKDDMADYLEAYVSRFDLEVRTGVTVERLTRDGDRLV